MDFEKMEKKQENINYFGKLIKEINQLDCPLSENLKLKKLEEDLEVKEAKEKVIEAITHLHSELADRIITHRDNSNFDFRMINAKVLSCYGIFEIMHLLSCEESILNACIEKAERTKERLVSGYYDK